MGLALRASSIDCFGRCCLCLNAMTGHDADARYSCGAAIELPIDGLLPRRGQHAIESAHPVSSFRKHCLLRPATWVRTKDGIHLPKCAFALDLASTMPCTSGFANWTLPCYRTVKPQTTNGDTESRRIRFWTNRTVSESMR